MTNRSAGTIHLVLGGQNGSEGKGEFIPFIAHLIGTRHVVRTGGSNAGHCITTPYGYFKMRQIPAAWAQIIDHGRPPVLYLGPGSLISPDVLMGELQMVARTCKKHNLRLPSIYIDESAVIIDDEHMVAEQVLDMRANIGSTTEGIGAARSAHTMRMPSLRFARQWWYDEGERAFYDDPILSHSNWACVDDDDFIPNKPNLVITNVSKCLESAIHEMGEDVLIESTQGFGLSLVHSGHYPYATSRDVTPGIILNDAGLSSREDHRVYAVVRTMPIRVAGNSGPMHAETDWETLVAEIDHLEEPETTTVTGNPRRIAKELDYDMLDKMVRHCRPDALCLTFLDYAWPELYRVTNLDVIRPIAGDYIQQVEERIGVPIRWVSTGPGCITEYA